ncbi:MULTISPECIES: DEAD/DEAH box helicase [unclassified Pseudoalteromonas]|uniref:DEAD/DEAH box helicase n=1 Tax=unclassified Pseudoalteromonas TaxID=194690 RepID=UPI0004171570|nr:MULTISPECIES: DEAD/DEAH box helicase [unclassified Pseudoalteromonas]MDN3402560.1 DEAD/DEAH box helicase [Pseudoalteromonas sp. APC 3213]MDN3432050.1 DEAD/DEAH box helicase [Pseudoalteromonas sp. APC 3907]MDN3466632.1 DEAD/DEAH box helicase [Pseudoalteromonas sp. APC 3495]TMS62601.1 ATP-dependent helicase [Pseudoalteromonas sp. S3173]TMS93206.1 ATP-dependent helicase [Pseudoalteromonas sp. S201]|tara:strand:+ start:3845 stop:6868 length:3024 start_codon:yes stop_codon:yes gene_type:complete
MSLVSLIKGLLPNNKNSHLADDKYSLVYDSYGVNFATDEASFHCLNKGEGGGSQLIQHVVLKMLQERDIAQLIPNGFRLDSEQACLLDPEDTDVLGLPPFFNNDFDVDIQGRTTKSSFTLQLFAKLENQKYPVKRKGPILFFSEQTQYLMTPEQLNAVLAVEKHSSLTPDDRTELNNVLAVAKLQQAVKDGLKLDLKHFDKFDLVQPEHITVTANQRADGSLELSPSFGDGSSSDDLQNRLAQLQGDGQVMRIKDRIVLLTDDKKQAVKEVLQNRTIPAHKVAEFIKTPSAFLDASILNLDLGFSLRVAGIGKMVHIPFGQDSDGSNGWFSTNTDSEPPERLVKLLECEEDVVSFEQSYQQAKGQNADSVFVDDESIDIRDEQRVTETLAEVRENLANPSNETDISDTDDLPVKKEQVSLLLKDTEEHNKDIVNKVSQLNKSITFDRTNLARTPFPHQESGISWMLSLLKSAQLDNYDDMYRVQGALLADDMGLGKTYMTLVMMAEYLTIQRQNNKSEKPILIVAPLSLLENWEQEVDATFNESPFRDIKVLQSARDLKEFRVKGAERESMQLATVIDDSHADHESIRYALHVGADAATKRLDMDRRVVITTYQTLRDYQFSLCVIDWGVVVFDEAQNIKNPNTQATRAAKGLKADFKLLATGTPVENSLSEFWCLMDTAQPGLLGDWGYFRERWIKPISSANEEEKAEVRLDVGNDLRNAAGQFMLRRTKEDELTGMPTKTIKTGIHKDLADNMAFAPELARNMTGGQLLGYNQIVEDYRAEKAKEQGGGHALTVLQQLRAVSLHPRLDEVFKQPPNNAKDAQRNLQESEKLRMLLDILSDIKNKKEKVIIFATTKKLQAVLKICLDKIYELNIHVINGDSKAMATKKEQLSRKGMITDFEAKDGFNIIIMSPVAAGVGLTVIGANHVVHLERHWNPAKEAQATDRVYRIGQKKPVFIHLPCLLHPEYDSFDVNLDKLLAKKTMLRDAVVTPEVVSEHELMSSMGL